MYGALEDQLREQDCALTVAALWKRTAEYMQSHSEDLLPFLTNPNTGNVYTPEEFGKYCDDIVNTAAWGGSDARSATARTTACVHLPRPRPTRAGGRTAESPGNTAAGEEPRRKGGLSSETGVRPRTEQDT
ncbi:Deubiquitinase OTUD6B [Lemmus lemmus]